MVTFINGGFAGRAVRRTDLPQWDCGEAVEAWIASFSSLGGFSPRDAAAASLTHPLEEVLEMGIYTNMTPGTLREWDEAALAAHMATWDGRYTAARRQKAAQWENRCRLAFEANLAAANEQAAEYGLPALTVEDALLHYLRRRHDNSPDRGSNNAGAGSRGHYGQWAVSLVLHEGIEALHAAHAAQNAAFADFVRATQPDSPENQALDYIRSITPGASDGSRWRSEWETTPPALATALMRGQPLDSAAVTA